MLKINPTKEAIKFHNEKVSEIFDKIINKKIAKELLETSTLKFLNRYKNILTCGKPILLLEVHKKFLRVISNQNQISLRKAFKEVAYKEQFQKKHSKEFLNLLNVETCTYCNRNYTLDFKNLKNSRAQLDHWFPKSDFPIVALSFYNLIPSCSSCNHIKHNNKPENGWEKALENLIHPYDETIDFSFSYKFEDFNNPKTWIKEDRKNPKIEKTIRFNKLREIYEAQSDKELKDLLDLRYKYDKNYLDILCNKTFEGLNLSREEAYRLIFGIEIKEEDYHKRTFSKFKKDIIEELKNRT